MIKSDEFVDVVNRLCISVEPKDGRFLLYVNGKLVETFYCVSDVWSFLKSYCAKHGFTHQIVRKKKER